MLPEDPNLEMADCSAPSVLLVRDSSCHTIAAYLERALAAVCNLKTVYVDQYPLFIGGFRRLPRVARTFVGRMLLHRSVEHDRALSAADLVLLVEPASLGFVPEDFAHKTAFYAIDSHLNFDYHISAYDATAFDYVFVAQKDYVPRYLKAGCRNVHWLPLAYDPTIHRKLELDKRRKVIFVGNPRADTDRGAVLRAMQQSLGMEMHQAYLHDMVRLFNESKIVFNRSLRGDVNMRVFEALGCESFLLTDRCANGFEELFTAGKDLVTYGSIDEARELAVHYLDSEEERGEISRHGHDTAERRHTYLHRASEILQVALGAGPTQANLGSSESL
jgi:spore maturation protein CgeB